MPLQFGDPQDVILSSKSGMTPFLVFGGALEEPQLDQVAIVAENQVLLHADGLLESIELMMMLYYVCNIEYPKEIFNTLFFLQRQVLQVFDTQKVPTKVLVFLDELSKV